MNKFKKTIYITIAIMLIFLQDVAAQCAMCKATVESSDAEGVASTINAGILYLFAAPYLAVAVVGYFWYKSSKANALKNDRRKSWQA